MGCAHGQVSGECVCVSSCVSGRACVLSMAGRAWRVELGHWGEEHMLVCWQDTVSLAAAQPEEVEAMRLQRSTVIAGHRDPQESPCPDGGGYFPCDPSLLQ